MQTKKYRVLYINHSPSVSGGAILSLMYLLEKLDHNVYTPIFVNIYDAPDVKEMLEEKGYKNIYWPGISVFHHTTAAWYSAFNLLGLFGMLKTAVIFQSSINASRRLIDNIKPDLVHLNSLILAPSAIATKQAGVKLVWHIRESVVRGHIGLRKRWLSRMVSTLADEAIFISEHDRQNLCPNGTGVVIPNYVDFKRFDKNIDGAAVRKQLQIPVNAKVVLFLGGLNRIKGGAVLLKALNIVSKYIPELWAIFAGAITPMSQSFTARLGRTVLPLFGKATQRQEFYQALSYNRIKNQIVLLPFNRYPEKLIAASDLVVFPSIEPHFARPVIEAGAMAKPVVASRIGGVEELVKNEKTGLLVTPKSPSELGDAICTLLKNNFLSHKMGHEGFLVAEKLYCAETNVKRTMAVYERLLTKHT